MYSVADPGCLSRILDLDIFSIPDPGSNNSKKKKRKNKLFVLPFFVAINITKLET
jgi:hypothetical protein